MAEKKDRSRFSLKFREGDPAHERTIQILESRGKRNIAPFIVNAVLHYVQCKETPDITHLFAENTQSVRDYRTEDKSQSVDKLQHVMDRKEIEQIVREILQEQGDGRTDEKRYREYGKSIFIEGQKTNGEKAVGKKDDRYINEEALPNWEINQSEMQEEVRTMIEKSLTGFRRA